jgi:hypothetical protein
MDNFLLIIKVCFIALVFVLAGRFAYEQVKPAPNEMTKEQYLNIAVENCAADMGKEICTCFYTRVLNERGVKGTMQLDIDATRNPDADIDNYTLNVLEGCL